LLLRVSFPLTVPPLCFPYQRRRLPLHYIDHLFKDACASARGHRGEEWSLHPSVKPGPRAESRITLSAAAPPRLCCVMPTIEPGFEAFLQVSPPSFHALILCSIFFLPVSFPGDHRATVPPPRTPSRRRTGSAEPFWRARLASMPKDSPFLITRLAWCRLAIGRAGFPRAWCCCACRRSWVGRQADADAHPCAHKPAPYRTPTCAHAHASARASPHWVSGHLTHAASRARESSPPAPASPATLSVMPCHAAARPVSA
jgi:hypothetical protein